MTIYIIKQILENRMNSLKTCAFMLSFLGIGLCESALGPSLLDLKIAVRDDFAVVWIMPACMIGYVIGAFLIGFVFYPYINPFLLNFFSLLSSALSLAFVGYNRTLVGMSLTFMVNGIALGIIDAIGHMTILYIWGKACDPFMQLLHFAFGLGGVLGPLIVSPFLVPLETNDETVNSTLWHAEEIYSSEDLRIQTAYQIISIIMVCVSTFFLYIYARHRQTLQHNSRMVASEDSNANHFNSKVHKIIISLATAFIAIYYGLEITMATFMTMFACASDLKLSKETGAMITSVYWSTYALFQLLSVFYIHIIGPEKNIIFLLATILVANCFLIPFGNTYVWCLWLGAALIGIGLSALWGSMFGYLENYFQVTNKIAGAFTIFACFGELVLPNIMNSFIEKTPTVFLWIILFSSLTVCILFAVINVLCKMFLIQPLTDNTLKIEE